MTRLRVDFEIAAGKIDSLFEARESERIAHLFQHGELETLAAVADLDQNVLAGRVDHQAGLSAMRVAGDVGQRFLHHAENGRFQLFGQATGRQVNVARDRDAGLAAVLARRM